MTETEAHSKGEQMLALLGEGFTLRVWENLGWHYGCVTDQLNVYPSISRNGGYTCLVGNGSSGKGHWHTDAHVQPTPQLAIKVALEQARKVVDEDLAIVQAAEATLADTLTHEIIRSRHLTH